MHRILKNIGLLFFCCITGKSFAQMPGTRIYTLTDEYQEQPRINTLFHVKQGYILAGTTKGLYRFDGINFKKLDKDKDVTDDVTAICAIPGNEILVGFNNGNIGKLQNNRIGLLSLKEGFPKVAISKILADPAGVIWIATAGEGLYYLKNNNLYNINTDDGLTDNFVYDITATQFSNVIAATDHGINICNANEKDKVVKTFTSKDGLPDNIVRCLFTADALNVWLGMQDGGVQYYNTRLPDILPPEPWQYGQVNAVMAISSNVFIATEDRGLLVFNSNADNKITTLQYKDERLRKVSCLLRDREGNVWAAGNNQLMRTVGSELQSVYTFKSDTYDDLHALLYAKNGDLWFNKKQKLVHLSKLPDGSLKENEFTINSIAPQSDITSLFQDEKGNIWIGTMGSGLVILDPITGKHRSIIEDPLLINGSILSISGKGNTIWIASLEGAVSCKGSDTDKSINQTFQCSNYADDQNLGSKYVYDILTDSKNRIWFATDGKGVILLENNTFTHFNKPGQINNEVVYKIVEDNQGNLWFNTFNNGIIKFDGKKFTSFGIAQGLSDLNVTSLAISGNYLLAAHKTGIDLLNTNTGNISYLDEEQGLNNINQDLNTFTKDQEGNIYFANGYTIYKYQTPFQLQQKPSIVIDKIQLFLTDTAIQSGCSFASDENNISFFYTGLFYSQPDKIQYQYKLEGYEKDWVSTNDHVQNFPQLPPGVYTFRVRVSLNQDFSLASEAGFTFTIKEPFWQQLWFIILSVIILAALIFLIIKQRESAIEKYNKLEREKIQSQLETLRNQINPHFLFNSFNTLISEIEDNPDKAVIYVEHLSDFYRSIVMHKEKDFISLEEEINILNDYFFIQQKRYGNALQIAMSISLQQQKTYFVVPLALQLLFENAVKHNVVSAENPLQIELFINDTEQLVVRNNIMAKFQPEKGSSMGLQNIQKRYELLCGRTVTVDNDNHFFTVKLPLIKQ